MLNLNVRTRVYLAAGPTDLRKGFGGLERSSEVS